MGKGKNSLLSSLTTCSQIWLFPPLDDLPCALHHNKIQQSACPIIIMAFTLAWIMMINIQHTIPYFLPLVGFSNKTAE